VVADVSPAANTDIFKWQFSAEKKTTRHILKKIKDALRIYSIQEAQQMLRQRDMRAAECRRTAAMFFFRTQSILSCADFQFLLHYVITIHQR